MAAPPAALAGWALWCERSGRLLWADAAPAQLRAWTPATGRQRAWRLPEPPYCFALTASVERLLLGLASGLAIFDLATGALVPVCPVAPGQAGTRISDGRCDRQGRFVFGTGADDPRAPPGAFYRLNHDLSLERLPLGETRLATGIGFSPDGRTMVYADAAMGAIRRCGYHPCSGEIGPSSTLVEAGVAAGAPGAVAFDAAGGLWSARRGAGQLVRFTQDGTLERVLELGAQPGWPLFGGPGLDTLYVTTPDAHACAGEDGAAPAGILAYATGMTGLDEQRFLGRLPSRT